MFISIDKLIVTNDLSIETNIKLNNLEYYTTDNAAVEQVHGAMCK